VDFLRIAERTGLILDIGSWVVEQVCRTAPRLRFLQTPDAGARPIRLAFNLSPLECRRGVLRHLLHALDETPLEATVIEIEVTEQVLGLPDGEDCTRDLREVRARGGSVAVRGFGGSAACISRALDLQVDKLKLHRSLVAAIGTKPGTRRTLRAMIDLGRSLGFDVVAEGVETGEQRAFLEHVSCPTIQGYLVAPPMQWPELEVWLEQHRTARPSVA